MCIRDRYRLDFTSSGGTPVKVADSAADYFVGTEETACYYTCLLYTSLNRTPRFMAYKYSYSRSFFPQTIMV